MHHALHVRVLHQLLSLDSLVSGPCTIQSTLAKLAQVFTACPASANRVLGLYPSEDTHTHNPLREQEPCIAREILRSTVAKSYNSGLHHRYSRERCVCTFEGATDAHFSFEILY
jgi:hypothetical protein